MVAQLCSGGEEMNEQQENKLLFKIAQMYYEEDMTQAQISKELNIYRTTISRMLKKIRDKGIVNITINYDLVSSHNLEKKLREKFNLKEAIVIPTNEDQSTEKKLKSLGQACAKFLEQNIQDDDIVGFSWGTALASVVNELKVLDKQNIICLPLVGGPAGRLESKYHVNTIVYEASCKLNGESLLIDIPAIMDNYELKEAISMSKHFEEIKEMWNKLSIAVFGIGSPVISSKSNWHAFYGGTFSEEMEKSRVVGDICSRFYDKNGVLVNTKLSNRTISIELDHLKSTRFSIGVAESIEKVAGISGALHGSYLDVLITTEETAKAILLDD